MKLKLVTIYSSTVRANLYETVYDTLNSANLLSSTATITAAYIDSDESFPQVIVNPVDVSRETPTLNRTYWRNNTLTINIDIYTKKAKQVDQLADEIDALISPLGIAGVQLVGLTESRAYPTSNQNKIHLKTMTYTYMR